MSKESSAEYLASDLPVITDLVKKDVTDVTHVTVNLESPQPNDLDNIIIPSRRNMSRTVDVTLALPDVTFGIPKPTECPKFQVTNQWRDENGTVVEKNGKYKPGVWYFAVKQGAKDENPQIVKYCICSPIHLEAITYDSTESNFGRLLCFVNSINNVQRWAMPMELLSGGGEELRRELLAMGVVIDYRKRNELSIYLQSELPKKQMICATQIGWCGDSFVLPDSVIGPSAKQIVFQNGERYLDEHTVSGSLSSWKKQVARYAEVTRFLLCLYQLRLQAHC